MILSFISTADTHGFGRVDFDSMSDQTLMELLVGDIENNAMLRDGDDAFLDIQSWDGLSFNDAGELIVIDFEAELALGGGLFGDSSDDDDEDKYIVGPKGSIDLKWIPKTVEVFAIADLELEGFVETSELSPNLECFDISLNLFRGTFCIASLPQNIRNVSISGNLLDGTLDIAKLPPNVTDFSAERNRFHGFLDFSDLPKNMATLRLSFNDFLGTIDLSTMPSKMRFFAMQGTKVKQDRLVIRVPDLGVQYFRLTTKNFGSVVDTSGSDLKNEFIYDF